MAVAATFRIRSIGWTRGSLPEAPPGRAQVPCEFRPNCLTKSPNRLNNVFAYPYGQSALPHDMYSQTTHPKIGRNLRAGCGFNYGTVSPARPGWSRLGQDL